MRDNDAANQNMWLWFIGTVSVVTAINADKKTSNKVLTVFQLYVELTSLRDLTD